MHFDLYLNFLTNNINLYKLKIAQDFVKMLQRIGSANEHFWEQDVYL